MTAAIAAPAPAGVLSGLAARANTEFIPGTSKPALAEVRGRRFRRVPIKSRLVVEGDDLAELVGGLTHGQRRADDLIVMSEKVVATTQGRAIPEGAIKPGLLARLLWRRVRKVPYGIGLRSPATMQCAIDECGHLRILAAAAAGAIGKALGRRGDFYRVAGMQAATIDAASTSPIPEMSGCVILGPKDPGRVAQALSGSLGCAVAIVDVNDIGGSWVLGASEGVDAKLVEDIMRDNPLGQGAEMTPFGIVREQIA